MPLNKQHLDTNAIVIDLLIKEILSENTDNEEAINSFRSDLETIKELISDALVKEECSLTIKSDLDSLKQVLLQASKNNNDNLRNSIALWAAEFKAGELLYPHKKTSAAPVKPKQQEDIYTRLTKEKPSGTMSAYGSIRDFEIALKSILKTPREVAGAKEILAPVYLERDDEDGIKQLEPKLYEYLNTAITALHGKNCRLLIPINININWYLVVISIKDGKINSAKIWDPELNYEITTKVKLIISQVQIATNKLKDESKKIIVKPSFRHHQFMNTDYNERYNMDFVLREALHCKYSTLEVNCFCFFNKNTRPPEELRIIALSIYTDHLRDGIIKLMRKNANLSLKKQPANKEKSPLPTL